MNHPLPTGTRVSLNARKGAEAVIERWVGSEDYIVREVVGDARWAVTARFFTVLGPPIDAKNAGAPPGLITKGEA